MGSHRGGIKRVQVQQLSVNSERRKQRKKRSKLVPARINDVQENVAFIHSCMETCF